MRIVKSVILLLLSIALVVGLIYESEVREDYAILFTQTSVESAPKKDVIAILQASAAVGNHTHHVTVDAVPDGISEVESTIKTNALETKTASGQAILEIGQASSELESAILLKPDTALARLMKETITNAMGLINNMNEE